MWTPYDITNKLIRPDATDPMWFVYVLQDPKKTTERLELLANLTRDVFAPLKTLGHIGVGVHHLLEETCDTLDLPFGIDLERWLQALHATYVEFEAVSGGVVEPDEADLDEDDTNEAILDVTFINQFLLRCILASYYDAVEGSAGWDDPAVAVLMQKCDVLFTSDLDPMQVGAVLCQVFSRLYNYATVNSLLAQTDDGIKCLLSLGFFGAVNYQISQLSSKANPVVPPPTSSTPSGIQ